MYKLFKLSAFNKQEITPIISAVQHDSARVVPVWIYDLDFSNIASEEYVQMSAAYPDSSYKQTDEYYSYNSTTGVYTYVAWDDLQSGVTYYKRTTHIRVIVRKPSGRRVVKDCDRCYTYKKMSTAYSSGNTEYKSTYEYFSKNEITGVYTAVAFASLVAGTTYYRKWNTVVLVPLSSNALTECGTSIGQIQLDYSSTAGSGQVATYKFLIKVEKSYIDGSISTNERANIAQLITRLQETIADLPTEEFSEEEMEDVWEGPITPSNS